ncbi:hypothetical protein B566_EDAN015321 [Ephemera danica]|nr:hypothetical protein B566_EDAN015321 [Ephemera danica]
MPNLTPTDDKYPVIIGLVFVFNLIVGTGALTLPSAFARAGWAWGLSVIIVLAFMSYVTTTYVVESMAAANAIRKLQKQNEMTENDSSGEVEEERSLLVGQERESDSYPLALDTLFCIEEKVELGEMATMFFNKWGRMLFYLCITIYLYGDLAIYAAAVSKSLTDVACTLTIVNGTVNTSVPDTAPCWDENGYSRMTMYRLFLATFVAIVGPFAFFNVQKTKYLQLFTSLMRWCAFCLMIGIAIHKLCTAGPLGQPPAASVFGVPALFGACVYSFMCHHSLPGLLQPIEDKSRLFGALAADYLLVTAFYLLLAFTGVFAFAYLEDLYTLVFWRPGQFVGYFLALFPVFTLSTNFPVVSVTLRSNLEALSPDCNSPLVQRVVFSLLAILPPTAIAMTTTDLSILVGVTGTYAGAGVQYVIPALLVGAARKHSHTTLGMSSSESKFASPFKGSLWLAFILVWSITCVILVTINLIEKLTMKV